MKRRPQRRARIVSETTASLKRVRRDLAGLRRQLDALAAQGAFVDVARVYWCALDWCARDVKRCLDCDEREVIGQAPGLLADLHTRLADPQRVLDHVCDKPPAEPDPLRVDRNPYFQAVIRGVRAQTRRERGWAKGRKGYTSIPNAWSMRGLGDDALAAVWAMTRPRSPLRHHPMLLAGALNLFEAIAHLHTDGDFNVDRTAIYGRDPNINRFCLTPALDGWCRLHEAYPDLLPPAKRADIEAGLKVLADYQVTDYGLPRLAKRPDVTQPAYPNMDVHHILIMEFAHRLWGDKRYVKERDAFVKLLASAVYPMGAWTYIHTQNECFVYHHLNVLYSARFWQLTRNPTTLAMLRKTIPYYPHNVEPSGMPEYWSDSCWKHYWGGGSAPGPEVIAGLFDDPLNKRVAQTAAEVWGYGSGHHTAIAAEFWKPIRSKALPDGYVVYDPDIQGPRGRYGDWSFGGNGRNHGVGHQGKDTFVGCMIADPARRPMPLDAALQVVTTEVRLNHTDNHWQGGRCHSAQEKLTTTVGPDFGSLAVHYTVSKPSWACRDDELYPWDGTQQWYVSRTRLVGLVALACTEDETRAAVHGRIRLGLKRRIKRIGATSWTYGKLVVRIHDHNFARIETRRSETFYLDKPSRYRSTEITLLDPLSTKTKQKHDVTFRKGTRYYFLVEVFPSGSAPAQDVERIERGPVVGFRFREPGRAVVVLHNPTDKPARVDLPLATTGRATVYRNHKGQGKPLGATTRHARLGAHRHLVAVGAGRGKELSAFSYQPSAG